MQTIDGRPAPIKDQIWKHTKTSNTYVVVGTAFNTITDRLDVMYKDHIQQSEYNMFTRQLSGTEKAFLSENEDGSHRFILIAHNAEHYMERFLND